MTSALGGGRWSAPRPGRFTPGKDPVPIVQEAGGAPRPVWTCAKNLAPPGFFWPYFARVVYFVSLELFWYWTKDWKSACCGFFHYEKSDGFGRERTRDLGFQGPARKPLDHRSRWRFDSRTVQPVVSRYTDWATRSLQDAGTVMHYVVCLETVHKKVWKVSRRNVQLSSHLYILLPVGYLEINYSWNHFSFFHISCEVSRSIYLCWHSQITSRH
jgi:hypothetical protein